MPQYEYTCQPCAARFTHLRPVSAAAEGSACPHCGATAPRALSLFAWGGRASEVVVNPTAPAMDGASLCRQYPQIPLLCHMEPKAAERWVAKATGREERYLEREARGQATATATTPPAAAVGVTADHLAGHTHPAVASQPVEHR